MWPGSKEAAGEHPAAERRAHEAVLVIAEERRLVDGPERKAVAAVGRRVGALGPKVLEVLNAAWAEHGREDLGRRVVKQVAPGVGRIHLQPLGEALVTWLRRRKKKPMPAASSETPVGAGALGPSFDGRAEPELIRGSGVESQTATLTAASR